jgi:hypothetical protein
LHLAKKTHHKLLESRKKLGSKEENFTKPNETPTGGNVATSDDVLMQEQLGFIYNVSKDIDKIATSLVEKPLNG